MSNGFRCIVCGTKSTNFCSKTITLTANLTCRLQHEYAFRNYKFGRFEQKIIELFVIFDNMS